MCRQLSVALASAVLTFTAACSEQALQVPSEVSGEGGAPAVTRSQAALFVNTSFESGDLTGWAMSTGLTAQSPGVQAYPVLSEAQLGLRAGGTARTYVRQGATLYSQVPPGLTSAEKARYPRFGTYTAIVNELGSSNNANKLTQSSVVTTGDIDPVDGLVHVRFTVLPVLQNPGHVTKEQPYYYVTITNQTKGTVLTSRFNFSNESGVPWQSNAAGDVVYTEWLLFDLPLSRSAVSIGDTLVATVIAGGCALGGHWGEALVDSFGSSVPGLAVYGSGPDSVEAGSDFQYTYRVLNGSSAASTGAKLTVHLPGGTSFRSIDTPGLSCAAPAVGTRGAVICDLGGLSVGGAQVVKLTVRADPTASGIIRHGWYFSQSNEEQALVGPLVSTAVTTGGTTQYLDLATSVDDGRSSVSWGERVTWTVTVSNKGPATATGARVTSNAPAQLANLAWTCAGQLGGTCAAPSGVGALNTTATLPAGARAVYTLTADVVSGSGPGLVSLTAQAAAPTGTVESFGFDNGGGDDDTIAGSVANVTVNRGGGGEGNIVSAPSGVSCGAGCSAVAAPFASGTQVTLSAVPAAGSRFAGWSGGTCSGSAPCTFTVASGQVVTGTFEKNPLAITSASSVKGAVGAPFRYVLSASGTAPVTLGATGLPAWLAFDAQTGVLSGTPPAVGTFSVTLSATDSGGSLTQALTITIGEAPVITSATTYSLAAANTNWNVIDVNATGTAPLQFNAGALPGTVFFNSTTGLFGGTAGATGVFNIPVVAINEYGSDSRIIAVSIGGAPIITSALSASAVVGSPFSYILTATGAAPLTLGVTALPAWASFDAATGVISGTPAQAGTFSIGLSATNGSGSSVQTLQLTVAGPAVITSALSASGTVGQPFTYSLTAEGSAPVVRGMTGVPAWASFDAASGILSGTPTAGGVTTIALSASNGFGSDAKSLVVSIAAPPSVTSPLSATAQASSPFSYTIMASGTGPMSFSAAGLPAWASVDAVTGVISGTPPQGDIVRFSVTASNAAGSDTKQVRLVISQTEGLPGWAIGRRYIVDHTGPDAGSLTDFQVRLTIDTATEIAAGRMNPDCSDLRVYDGSGCSPTGAVDFWVADGTCNTAQTHVWLKLPNIPAQSLTPLAVFWGNPSATSASNGPATFPRFFDDFNGPSFDTTRWNVYGPVSQGGGFVTTGGGASGFWSKAEVMEAGQTVFGVRTDAQSASGADIEYGAATMTAPGAGAGNIHWSARTWTGVAWMSYDHKYAFVGRGSSPGVCQSQMIAGRWANAPGVLNFFQTEFFYELNPSGSSTFGIYDKTGAKLETTLGAPGCAPGARERVYWQYDHSDGLPNPISRVDYAYVRSYAKPDPVVLNTGIAVSAATCRLVGQGPCTPATAGTVCQSARCGADSNVCLPNRPDACQTDGDCAQGQLCIMPGNSCVTPIAPSITSSTAAQGLVVNTPWSYSLTATGTGPLTLAVSGLPAWASFDAATGVISGTPPADGTFSLSLTATNRVGSDTKTLTLTVRTPPSITNTLVAYAEVGRAFSFTLTASGTAPITFGASSLPAGVTRSGDALSGTPTQPGRADVAQTASNPAGSDAKTLVIHVRGVIPAPVITGPAEGAQLNDANVTFTGTAPLAEAGLTVRVREGGQLVCEATVQADGTWSCQATRSEGAHDVTAALVSTGGLEGTAVDRQAFSIDLTAPAVPAWEGPAEGEHLAVNAPRLSGRGEPGARVFVTRAGQPVCDVLVASDGTWACVPGVALPEGTHQLSLAQRDAAGNWSNAVARTVHIDTLAPVAPTLVGPAPNATLRTPQPPFTGTAEPGSAVKVFVEGQEHCSTVADAQGQWSCTGPALPDGTYQVQVTSTDEAGNMGTSPQQAFTIDTVAPVAPTLSGPPSSPAQRTKTPAFTGTAEPGSAVTVIVDGQEHCRAVADAQGQWSCTGPALTEGTHQVAVTSTDEAGNESSIPQRPFSIDTVDPVAPVLTGPALEKPLADPRPSFTGTGEPGSVIVVWIDGREHCRTTADAQGAWSCSGPSLTEGTHQVSVTSIDEAGNEGELPEQPFIIDTVAPPAVVITGPTGRIDEPSPTITGTSEPGALVVVTVDGRELCRTTADAQGRWSCPVTQSLVPGLHDVTAKAIDAAGNEGPTVAGRFDVQTAKVGVTTMPTTDETDNGSLTGTAPPGSTVNVYVDGKLVGSTTAGPDGSWSFDLPRLPAGAHEVTVGVTGSDGSEVYRSPSQVMQVDGVDVDFGGGLGCSSAPTSSTPWMLGLVALFLVARRRVARGAVAAAVATVCAGTVAQAQTEVAQLAGFEVEQLQLNPGARGGLAVGGADLLLQKDWRVAVSFGYQHAPVKYFENGQLQALLVEHRGTAVLSGAVGVLPWLEVGAQLPVVLFQSGQSATTRLDELVMGGVQGGAAMGTPWLQARANLLQERSGSALDLGLTAMLGLPLGSNAALTRDATVSGAVLVGAGRTFGPLRAALEAGVHLRPTSALSSMAPEEAVGSRVLLNAGLSTVGGPLRGELSFRGFAPLTAQPFSAEVLAGVRYAFSELELFALGGPGFGNAPGTPVFRAMLGVSFGGVKSGLCSGRTHAPAQCPGLDLDGDGVLNAEDLCPDVRGTSGGCPVKDADGDGVADAQDACPAVKGGAADGCPLAPAAPIDSDGDGVGDARDACPGVKGSGTDGCEPAVAAALDSDLDGVADEADACPQVKGTQADGCVAGVALGKLDLAGTVYFETGKAVLQPRSFPLLDEVVQVMAAHPEVTLVRIEGHTDGRGGAAPNLVLSQARAEAVKAYLVKKGVAATRLEAKGYGLTRPLETNATPAGRERNRRVDFIVLE